MLSLALGVFQMGPCFNDTDIPANRKLSFKLQSRKNCYFLKATIFEILKESSDSPLFLLLELRFLQSKSWILSIKHYLKTYTMTMAMFCPKSKSKYQFIFIFRVLSISLFFTHPIVQTICFFYLFVTLYKQFWEYINKIKVTFKYSYFKIC